MSVQLPPAITGRLTAFSRGGRSLTALLIVLVLDLFVARS